MKNELNFFASTPRNEKIRASYGALRTICGEIKFSAKKITVILKAIFDNLNRSLCEFAVANDLI